MNRACIFYIVLFICSCSGIKSEKKVTVCNADSFSQQIEGVSFENENEMKKFSGKFIEISGVFRFNFEDVALYSPKSPELNHALWIEVISGASISDSLMEQFNGKHVTVIGRLDTSKRGHLGGYFGTLDSAFCFRVQ